MKAYLGIKFHPDHKNKSLIEQISSILEKCGFQTVCIVRDIEKWGQFNLTANLLMEKTFEVIESCDIVIIDLSEKGVGLGIEAGFAYSKRIPVVTIARAGSDISNTLKGISQEIFMYEDVSELGSFFEDLNCLVISPGKEKLQSKGARQ